VSAAAPEPAPAAGAPDGAATGRHLPTGASVGDRRGLTALGAVALALVLGMAGGAVDVATGPGLRTVFAVCFVVGCGLAALLVHREDLVAAVVMPPLVYVALALLGGAVEKAAEPGSFVTQQALELVNALVLGAPVLISATAVALLVALARAVLGRRPA
jgi:cation transporter-like permease